MLVHAGFKCDCPALCRSPPPSLPLLVYNRPQIPIPEAARFARRFPWIPLKPPQKINERGYRNRSPEACEPLALNLWPFARIARATAPLGSRGSFTPQLRLTPKALKILALALLAALSPFPSAAQPANPQGTPPQLAQARRFLAHRGWSANGLAHPGWRANSSRPLTQSPGAATWQPFGPTAVLTPGFGLVTGRVSALALDPSDPTGNRLYVGTTGGGVWLASECRGTKHRQHRLQSTHRRSARPVDEVDASISIGALAVQPGGTGVVLAGTGDPNDALDSYYGAGILRSADNGTTWTLIQLTADQQFSFIGEGFAGFALSTANPQLVVAAVSQA